ncbi:hypothetical protein N015_01995 [Pseudomonas asturiensis]|uniref:Uncharacterized protein n=1 Tax=Pseudomonas asturiensis TaxID=1190415 RepID=A0ABX6H6T2_9PSED|nr:hypothetical protein [Pseudomonas asturiensis]QHF01241.1 hypothetical protein N015_01995 [Pseudomonas asturiensis]
MSDNPVKKLLQSINKSTHVADLMDKLGEVALDRLFDNDIVKEIPIVGTAIALLKAGDDFRAYAFVKKVTVFLQEVESVSIEDRDLFFKRYCDNPEKLSELGETTLMALDRIDHPTLAQMYGRAFAIMLKGNEHAWASFDLHSFTIKNMSPYLLRNLESYYRSETICNIDTTAAQALSNYGLINISTVPRVTNDKKAMFLSYDKTSYGKFFYSRIVKGLPADA